MARSFLGNAAASDSTKDGSVSPKSPTSYSKVESCSYLRLALSMRSLCNFNRFKEVIALSARLARMAFFCSH
jgi:hypothetical protein